MTTYRKSIIWTTILVVQIVLYQLASRITYTIHFYEWFFEVQKKAHQTLFSWINFSFGDLLYCILFIILIIRVTQLFIKKKRRKAITSILIILNIIFFLYQIFWGMLYFQKPLLYQFNQNKVSLESRKKLALKYLELCKDTREKVEQDNRNIFTISSINTISKDIIAQQALLPSEISQKSTPYVISIKPSLFGEIMNFTGILGYYNPFTAEAQVNFNLPSTMIPFTLAHESAHQLGFAREQEANFIAYLIGKDSSNISIRYSTQYFTLKSLLNSIIWEDEVFVEKLLNQYSEGMKNDRKAEKEFILKHQGWLDQVFSVTNDIFLKTNQQEGSITYSYFVELLVKYEESLQ